VSPHRQNPPLPLHLDPGTVRLLEAAAALAVVGGRPLLNRRRCCRSHNHRHPKSAVAAVVAADECRRHSLRLPRCCSPAAPAAVYSHSHDPHCTNRDTDRRRHYYHLPLALWDRRSDEQETVAVETVAAGTTVAAAVAAACAAAAYAAAARPAVAAVETVVAAAVPPGMRVAAPSMQT
jgi:hypothetical protein